MKGVAISDGCYTINLLLIYHKRDIKFTVHHHRHSIYFLTLSIFIWLQLVQLIFYPTDFTIE